MRTYVKKLVCAASACALAFGLCACSSATAEEEDQAPDPAQEAKCGILLEIEAEGWDADTSTPVMVSLVSAENIEDGIAIDAELVDYYALDCNEEQTIEVEEGTYELSLVSPINADGSIYTVPEPQEVEAVEITEDSEATPYEFTLIAAADATSEQVSQIVSSMTAAVTASDLPESYKQEVLDKCAANAAANPNVDEATVDAAADAGESAAASGDAAGAVTSGSAATSTPAASGSAPSGGSAPAASTPAVSAPAHTHSFTIPVTKTVHHDAVMKGVTVCNACGAENIGSGHVQNHVLNEGNYNVSTYVKTVTVTPAWDETVTTGHKCSCGAVQ